MLAETLLVTAIGAVVGLALGLTGGGGSMFALPLLVYGLGLPPAEAAALAVIAVATTAAVGAVGALRQRLVVWQPTILFGLGGIVTAPLGVMVAGRVPPTWLVAAFGLLALTIGLLMWRGARIHPERSSAVRARSYAVGGGPICVLAPDGQLRFTAPCAAVLGVIGLATGFLSGVFGVGGGFLIVPALMLVTRMGVHRAVATSLLIIAAISLAGATSAFFHERVDWWLLAPFAAGGAAAMLAARAVAVYLAGPRLQMTFAILIVLVGVGMLADAVL